MNKTNVGATTNTVQILLDVFTVSVAFAISVLVGMDVLSEGEVLEFFVLAAIFCMIYIISNNTKEVQKVFYSNKDELNYVSKDIVDKILRNEVVLKQDVNTVNELKLANISLVVSDIPFKNSLYFVWL